MNRKMIALNLGLLALLGTLGWMLRSHWRQTRAQELATLAKAPRTVAPLPPPSPAPPEPAVPANYIEVAQKTLFSKDRNPNVVIEVAPPPPPKPEEPLPPRPVYYGQMGLGVPVAFLSAEKVPQKGFRAGEEIGPFKLVAFNRDTITFEWHGKTLEYPLAELKPKEAAVQPGAVAAPAPQQRSSSSGSVIGAAGAESNPIVGQQNGDLRSCVAGDNSPAGTVKDGYRKVVVPGPFGPSCHWEQVK